MSECVVKYNLYLDKLINAWWCLGVQLGGQYISTLLRLPVYSGSSFDVHSSIT